MSEEEEEVEEEQEEEVEEEQTKEITVVVTANELIKLGKADDPFLLIFTKLRNQIVLVGYVAELALLIKADLEPSAVIQLIAWRFAMEYIRYNIYRTKSHYMRILDPGENNIIFWDDLYLFFYAFQLLLFVSHTNITQTLSAAVTDTLTATIPIATLKFSMWYSKLEKTTEYLGEYSRFWIGLAMMFPTLVPLAATANFEYLKIKVTRRIVKDVLEVLLGIPKKLYKKLVSSKDKKLKITKRGKRLEISSPPSYFSQAKDKTLVLASKALAIEYTPVPRLQIINASEFDQERSNTKIKSVNNWLLIKEVGRVVIGVIAIYSYSSFPKRIHHAPEYLQERGTSIQMDFKAAGTCIQNDTYIDKPCEFQVTVKPGPRQTGFHLGDRRCVEMIETAKENVYTIRLGVYDNFLEKYFFKPNYEPEKYIEAFAYHLKSNDSCQNFRLLFTEASKYLIEQNILVKDEFRNFKIGSPETRNKIGLHWIFLLDEYLNGRETTDGPTRPKKFVMCTGFISIMIFAIGGILLIEFNQLCYSDFFHFRTKPVFSRKPKKIYNKNETSIEEAKKIQEGISKEVSSTIEAVNGKLYNQSTVMQMLAEYIVYTMHFRISELSAFDSYYRGGVFDMLALNPNNPPLRILEKTSYNPFQHILLYTAFQDAPDNCLFDKNRFTDDCFTERIQIVAKELMKYYESENGPKRKEAEKLMREMATVDVLIERLTKEVKKMTTPIPSVILKDGNYLVNALDVFTILAREISSSTVNDFINGLNGWNLIIIDKIRTYAGFVVLPLILEKTRSLIYPSKKTSDHGGGSGIKDFGKNLIKIPFVMAMSLVMANSYLNLFTLLVIIERLIRFTQDDLFITKTQQPDDVVNYLIHLVIPSLLRKAYHLPILAEWHILRAGLLSEFGNDFHATMPPPLAKSSTPLHRITSRSPRLERMRHMLFDISINPITELSLLAALLVANNYDDLKNIIDMLMSSYSNAPR